MWHTHGFLRKEIYKGRLFLICADRCWQPVMIHRRNTSSHWSGVNGLLEDRAATLIIVMNHQSHQRTREPSFTITHENQQKSGLTYNASIFYNFSIYVYILINHYQPFGWPKKPASCHSHLLLHGRGHGSAILSSTQRSASKMGAPGMERIAGLSKVKYINMYIHSYISVTFTHCI